MWSLDKLEITLNGETTICECQTKYLQEKDEELGLYGGRIIKLFISANGEWICEFERDYDDVLVKNEVAEKAMSILMKKYN